MNMVKQLLQFVLKIVIFNLLKGTFLMKFNDGKTFSAYVRPILHSSYITVNKLNFMDRLYFQYCKI